MGDLCAYDDDNDDDNDDDDDDLSCLSAIKPKKRYIKGQNRKW